MIAQHFNARRKVSKGRPTGGRIMPSMPPSSPMTWKRLAGAVVASALAVFLALQRSLPDFRLTEIATQKALNCNDSEVARAGIEPATFRFSGGRSYQLSYLAGGHDRATPNWRP
jgi:hypothetical protein